MCSEVPTSSDSSLIPPGVALMPDDFPERLEAVRTLFDLNCEEMAVALGVDPRQLMRWRIKGRRSQRWRDAGPGAAGDPVAEGPGEAAGRGRDRDLQTEEE